MMHPDTELRYINQDIGFGVFATSPVPEGTIVYVQDVLDIIIDSKQYDMMDQAQRKIIDRYAFIDQDGCRVLCWDHARYVNHCCHANTISTGYGFEIAVRDIVAGEEITDEYGLLNLPSPVQVSCRYADCRKQVLCDDIKRNYRIWDSMIIKSLGRMNKVPQPLIQYLEDSIREQVFLYISGHSEYRSVLHTRYP